MISKKIIKKIKKIKKSKKSKKNINKTKKGGYHLSDMTEKFLLKTIFDNFTFPVTPAYDFGGIENPLEGNNITVVDIEPNEYGEFEEDNYIQADLSKYIELPPRKGIFMGHSLIYIENYPTIAKTIDAALQPGGLLIISDWLDPINDIIPYLQSYKLLEVFTLDDDLEDMSVSVTLKK